MCPSKNTVKTRGLIAFFELENWWQTELNEVERTRLIETYGKQLLEGEIYSTSKTKLSFLCNLSSFWKPSNDDLVLAKKIRAKAKTINSTKKEDEFWINWLIETEVKITHTADDEKIAELNRTATRFADKKDYLSAVDCLIKARALTNIAESYPIQLQRLPLFLQKAGMGKEAILEMIQLIKSVPELAGRIYVHGAITNDNEIIEQTIAGQYESLYDKLRLILKREGLVEQARLCECIAKEWLAITAAYYKKNIMKEENIEIPPKPLKNYIDLQNILID